MGINTNDPKAQLDVEAADAVSPQPSDGLLVPRVQTLPAAGADQHSMIIYLTNEINNLIPGFYYWDENVSSWTSFGGGVTAPNGDYWSLEGNTGTNSATDFIGTTDNEDFVIRTNNQSRLRVSTKSQLEFLNTGNSVFLGESAGANDDLSNGNNTFVGHQSGEANTNGSNNTTLGYRALRNNEIGGNNVAVGSQALSLAGPNANNNIAIGSRAGFLAGVLPSFPLPENLLYIGYRCSPR